MTDKQNSKIDLGKTIISIRSQFEAPTAMGDIEAARDRCKILCKTHGLKWWMVLGVDLENIRWAIQNNDLKNFLL